MLTYLDFLVHRPSLPQLLNLIQLLRSTVACVKEKRLVLFLVQMVYSVLELGIEIGTFISCRLSEPR